MAHPTSDRQSPTAMHCMQLALQRPEETNEDAKEEKRQDFQQQLQDSEWWSLTLCSLHAGYGSKGLLTDVIRR